ncbi:MAG: hypothetical protein JO006_10040 [Paucibacter sp.]|nr:hypothetical protein [Roseateles sp.]
MMKPLRHVLPFAPRLAAGQRTTSLAAASAAACLAIGLAGCTTPEPGMVPAPLLDKTALNQNGQRANALEQDVRGDQQRQILVGDTPQIPAATRESTVKPAAPPPAGDGRGDITLAFNQQPLPAFVQLVFGQVLKANFSMDPALLLRTDLVTLRTGKPQTPAQVLETVRMLLKSYGVAVQEMGGFYRIVPDSNQSAYLPEIRRGRAQPEVPLPLRPVFNLVEMSAVKASDVGHWLTAMFGQRITVQEDPTRNALMLSGQSADLTAALEAVQVLDQPLMRSRGSQLITPAVLSADDLARRLNEVLGAEGYVVGMGQGAGSPISLLPVPASNALLVFATDPAVLKHVMDWANKLDSLANQQRRGGNYFSYEVQYADAQQLAKTLQELMGAQQQQVVPTGAVVVGAPRQVPRVVVNAATNTLIVNTTNPDDYAQLQGLLKTLDKPSKSVLIEVTVAEVNRNDADQLGIEWNGGPTAVGNHGGTVIGGTTGGLSLGSGGLSLSYLNAAGVLRAKLNALASTNRARILSSPRVMARNGEPATIQVGEQVPIITSQQSTATVSLSGGTSATPGVLQTIQYHDTGVILQVKPVIFAGRVELEVKQEVSSAATTTTGVNVSPTFSTRKVDTKLSIRDGATVALGGLISRTVTDGDAGIPLLKDIPFAGQLFRTNTKNVTENELIILITPYVIDNDAVAEEVTGALRSQLGSWTGTELGRASQPLSRSAAPEPQSVQAPVTLAPAPIAAEPTPAAASAPAPAPAAALEAKESNTQPSITQTPPVSPSPDSVPVETPAIIPTGREVADPALLEELRRAAASGSNTAPATPATKKPAVKKHGVQAARGPASAASQASQ